MKEEIVKGDVVAPGRLVRASPSRVLVMRGDGWGRGFIGDCRCVWRGLSKGKGSRCSYHRGGGQGSTREACRGDTAADP